MHSEQQHQQDRSIDRAPADPNTSASPWSDLHLSVPNDRSSTSIVAFIECVLVELTHENVGAEYRSSNIWGVKLTQYMAADATGETFTKRHYDERLGWHEQTIPRADVRDDLVNRLSRSSSLATNQSHDAPVDEPDTFAVKARHQLKCEMRSR